MWRVPISIIIYDIMVAMTIMLVAVQCYRLKYSNIILVVVQYDVYYWLSSIH